MDRRVQNLKTHQKNNICSPNFKVRPYGTSKLLERNSFQNLAKIIRLQIGTHNEDKTIRASFAMVQSAPNIYNEASAEVHHATPFSGFVAVQVPAHRYRGSRMKRKDLQIGEAPLLPAWRFTVLLLFFCFSTQGL